MFIVKKRSELVRFGLFLALAALLAWFVSSRVDLWRLSQEFGPGAASTGGPLLTASRDGSAGSPAGADAASAGADGSSATGLRPAIATGLDLGEGQDYFAEYRIDRERIRGALGERLKELMDSPSAAEEVRKQASQQYLRLGETAALEGRAEAMVKARGFADVIVHLAEGSAQVVVKAASLTQQQVIEVMDTVSRTTGVKTSAITVMAKYQ